MVTVCLRYWAGAKAAAGTGSETVEADTVAEALGQARERRADPRFDRVLAACSVLVDGRTVRGDDLTRPLPGPVTAELLPPFAGGASARGPRLAC